MRKLRLRIVDAETQQALPGVIVTLNSAARSKPAGPSKRGKRGAAPLNIAQQTLGRLQSNADGIVAFSSGAALAADTLSVTLSGPRGTEGSTVTSPLDAFDLNGLTMIEAAAADLGMLLEEEAVASPHLPWTDGGISLDDVLFSPSLLLPFPELEFGDDACERMVPNDQTVRRFETREAYLTERGFLTCEEGDADIVIHKGEMLHYSVEWARLGYSYGDLIYSLALTPGEHVCLSVSTWEQRQFAQASRTNETQEVASASYRRANALSESMDGISRQFGVGAAVQAGQSSSTSAAGSGQASGTVPVKGINIGMKLAGSVKSALSTFVGGTVQANYNRKKVAMNASRTFTENIQQSADRWRRDHQTIIAEQTVSQEQAFSTRAVCNKNYCRVLNVFYHEVLENHRVTTRLTGSQDVLFVPHTVEDFDEHRAWCTKPFLESYLLDPSLAGCYDGLGRRLHGNGGQTSTSIRVSLSVVRLPFLGRVKNLFVTYRFSGGATLSVKIPDITSSGAVQHDLTVPAFDASRITHMGIRNGHNRNQIVTKLEISIPGTSGNSSVDGAPGALQPGGEKEYPLERPAPEEGPTLEEDAACAAKLVAHLNCHKHYYNALLWLMEDANQRIARFEDIACNGNVPLIDRIDPTPVGVFGDYVIFPMSGGTFDPDPDLTLLDDRLVVLPTSGVFADAALGRCTTCEPPPDDPDYKPWEIYKDGNRCNCGDKTAPTPVELKGLLSDNSLAFPNLIGDGKGNFATFVTPPTTTVENSLVKTFGTKFAEALFGDDTKADLEGLKDLIEKLKGTVDTALKNTDAELPEDTDPDSGDDSGTDEDPDDDSGADEDPDPGTGVEGDDDEDPLQGG